MSDADAHIDAKTFPYTRPQPDHADTIRRAVSALLAQDSWQKPLCIDAIQALDALLAENSRLNVSEAAWTARALEAEAERQQAIDALRDMANRSPLDPASPQIARAALVKLGEQP